MTSEWAIFWAAVIAGAAGFGGAFVASRIAAQESRDSRAEARALRFDDRLREVASEILHGAARYSSHVAGRQSVVGRLPDPEVDEVYRRACYELELVARLPETIAALQAVENAQYVLYDFDYQLHGPEEDATRIGPLPDDLAEWAAREEEHEQALHRFKTAVRAELGLGPMPKTGYISDLDRPAGGGGVR